jgi:hypothetical protein
MFRKLSILGVLLCAVVLMGQGCFTQTQPGSIDSSDRAETENQQTEDAPEEQGDAQADDTDQSGEAAQDLSDTEQGMIGEWRLVEIEGDIGAGPMGNDIVEWTFNADGTGEYYQNPEIGKEGGGEIEWNLDGENRLSFSGEGVGYTEPQYRVVEVGEQTMRWENLVLGGYYILEKK